LWQLVICCLWTVHLIQIWFVSEPNSQSSSKDGAEVSRLQKQNMQLKEENNFLKYKIEVLLDMVSLSTQIILIK